MITEMAEAWRDTQMVINMMVNLKITNRMVKAFIHGLMERYMRASGKEDLKRVKAFGKEYSETHI
jgi:hypothetical protein